ncbi:alpha-E domain-containing protein [Rhodobacter capsulatus]|uniref:Alpha-E domain-containing protein n=1 Tax=Rhodobacter capsulatus TaxID=1061 RepID=A0A0Q0QUC2_RHOCA|nr:alpha-E domain-containing protein [Rhodobacter capsulatus]KQB13827.1 A alpha-helical domain with a conserved ER moti [Rhodobacter capsulatus]KQB15477.1 A alpha-helical domain with a conserved ER moti [Rhodobacter capsulatus]PZX28319.1 putative alpha-E superfamily protein [Rhodobacter capsulatus]QNR62608.1 alpha-E domain-containing protein [Rhodobacter capsulatus]TKD15405.1 alpha-E domain-containing protein [Rhodobacter capsulatus]
MLSRTAENLFWIARYIERAETMARLLEVGARIALMPSAGHGYRSEWESLLQASGTAEGFAAKYGDPVQRNIESYLFFDRDNPSSVVSCIERARENARIVRTALTSQVWDALNGAFQEMRQLERKPRSEMELTELTEWVTRQAALVRGAIDATLLRNDGYAFLNLGFALERADNTARLIDVKYYVLLPSVDFIGSGLDNYQWQTLLRALSAHRAFHWAYGGEITAAKIAHFLILNPQSPRSLVTTVTMAMENLDALARGYQRSGAAQMRARSLVGEIAETRVEEIFDEGLHEFLTRFIRDVGELSDMVQAAYLSGEAR